MKQRSRDGDERRGAGRWWAAASGTGLLAAAVLAGAWALLHVTGGHYEWLLRAVTSRLFVFCAALLTVCGSIFAAMAAVLWQAGRPGRARRRAQEGAAIIEFALALPFMLLLSLLMAQTSLVMAGNVCVHYSAFCAARAAIVTIPRDYGVNEPRNYLKDNTDASGKLQRLKMAAAWAVMPVSCGSKDIAPAGDSLPNGLLRFFSVQGLDPPKWVDERLARKLGYAIDHTEVSILPPEVDEDDDDEFYDEHEDLRVTVRHTLYLAIPMAAKLFATFPGGVELNFGEGEYGTVIGASCSLPNEGVQDYVDIEKFPFDRQ
ncbi:MAG: hypothetical protein WBF17_04360 [Phycisphaerae bacterium]